MEMLAAMFSKFGKTYQPGEIIFCEYEPGNDFFFIQDGQVKIIKTVGKSTKTLDILETGDIFGEMAILEEAPRSATAVAMGEVKVLNFNRANFDQLMTRNPQLALRVLTLFSTRIYDAKRRLMILLKDDLIGKIADVFLMLWEKEYPNTVQKQIVLKTTAEDIANWCGQSARDVQKQLQTWKKMNKLEVKVDQITINNIVDFQRIVNQHNKK